MYPFAKNTLLAKYNKKTVVLKSTNIMTTKFRFG